MVKLEQESFEEPVLPKKYDEESIVIHARRKYQANHLILFIHGLTGHRYGYWGNLPQYCLADHPVADVGLYYYRTAWKRRGTWKSIDLDAEARVLADAIRQLPLYSGVTIVGHSMGGLLAKAAIADLVGRRCSVTLNRIRTLILLACPQLGSLRVPRLLKVFSRDGRALFPHNRLIQQIDTVFNSSISIDQAAERFDRYAIPTFAVVAAEDFWVDPLSAGIGVPECQKLTVRGSHGDIVRPPHKGSDAYAFLSACIAGRSGPPDKSADGEIEVEDARAEDCALIRKLAVEFFGGDVTPEERLKQFASIGGILKVVREVETYEDERRQRFAGYFCIIPLSVKSSESVKSGELKGSALTTEHVSKTLSETGSLYIGGVAARGRASRAVVLVALRYHIQAAAAEGVKEILTRPLTERGLELVVNNRFTALAPPGGLGALYVRSLTT